MADAGVSEAAAAEGAKSAGEAAAADGAVAAGAAEGGTAMGASAGVLGAADSAAASSALGLTAADVAGGVGAAGAASAGMAGSGWLSQALTSASGELGSAYSAMGGAKGALGAVQLLSSLYGLQQSGKLKNAAGKQAVTAAGLQGVMRNMASQGYQGSGNMMTALSNYAGGAYAGNIGAQDGALLGQFSSLGLLGAGVQTLTGWKGA